MREGSARRDAEELEAWTEEFVLAGAAVRRHRALALEEWLSFFGPLCAAAGPEYAAIRVHYSAGGESEEDLREACARLSPAERRRGHCLAGPQRDDLVWTRGGKPLAATASAGEVSRVVALTKLAEWRAVARAAGESPLFGVDEFDAGLSAGGVEALVRGPAAGRDGSFDDRVGAFAVAAPGRDGRRCRDAGRTDPRAAPRGQ